MRDADFGSDAAVQIREIEDIHLTLFESGGLGRLFRARGFSPKDVRKFSADLQQHINETDKQHKDITATVHQERPFVWRGRGGNRVALNIRSSDALLEERELITGFFRGQFGKAPAEKSFAPHITFAEISDGEHSRDPRTLFPEGLAVPSEVTLNGLVVYLGAMDDASSLRR